MRAADTEVTRYFTGSADVVQVVGEVTVLCVDEFREKLTSAAETADRLVLDLRECRYVDSAALEVIIQAYSKQTEHGGSMEVLARQGSQPDEVLKVIYLHTLTTVTDDPAEVGLEA